MSNWKERTIYFLLFLPLLLTILASCSNSTQKATAVKQSVTALPTVAGTAVDTARCQENGGKSNENGTGGLQVTIDTSCSIGTSQFMPGITHADTSMFYPWNNNNAAAINNVKALLKGTIPYQNTHIMGWGLPDPWPNPSDPEPTDWGLLDKRVQLAVETGGIPMISLDEAPWWMKGQIRGKNPARTLSSSEEWSTIAYESRILDNKMDAWLHLVQRVAERYMAPPYNVRYFQVWNELKGYYDPAFNNYDFTDSPGDPSGPYAEHGYTYMYNQVYATLMKVAQSLGITPDAVKVGGPYVFMDTWSSRNQSDPSNVTKAYGTFDQRPLDVIQYWLQHKTGAGFITVDGSVENRDSGKLLADPFTAAEVFGDVVTWIRSLDPTIYPGSTTLPVWFAEWFAAPRNGQWSPTYDDAVKAYAMISFIKAGGAIAMVWGGSGDGSTDLGLWSTTTAGGGQPRPWYFTTKALKDYFSAGANLYKTTVSDTKSIAVLASNHKIMLVNKTARTLTVKVNKGQVSLAPYEVKLIDYASIS